MTASRLAAALVAVATLASAEPAIAEAGSWALGPGAEPVARKLSVALQRTTGQPPGPTRIEGDTVRFKLGAPETGAAGSWSLTHDEPTSDAGAVRTAHGWLRGPAGVANDVLARAKAAVDGVSPVLPWVAVDRGGRSPLTETDSLPSSGDPAAHAATLAARKAAVAGRDDGALPDTAAAPDRRPLRQVRGSAPVWVHAAEQAASARRPREALALADAATRFANPDQAAVLLWRRLTSPPASDPIWPTGLVVVGLALWLMAHRRVGGVSPSLRGPALLCTLAIVAHLLLRGGGGEAPERPRPLPDSLLAPLAGGPCAADPALWTPEGLAVYAECGEDAVAFIISARGPQTPASVPGTARHAVLTQGPAGTLAARAGAAQVRAALAEAEAAGFDAAGWSWDGAAADAPALPRSGSPDRVETSTTAAIMLLGVLASLFLTLELLGWSVGTTHSSTADRGLVRGLQALGLIALLAALLLPPRLAMEYTGYDLTARLAGLASLPRYGAGAAWLYQLPLWLGGLDHASLQAANRIFGALTLIPVIAWGLAAAGGPRRAALWAPALFVLLPVVARDHVAEGIGPGTVWLLTCGLAGLTVAWVDEERRALAIWGFAALAAAATCRPEVGLALVPITLGALVAAQQRMPVALAAAASTVLLVPHALWLAGVARAQAAQTGILGASDAMQHQLPEVLTRLNLFVDGPWVSPALLVLIAAAALLRPAPGTQRRGLGTWWLGLGVAALLWLAATAVDLPRVSIPRVHLPVLVLLLPLCVVGAARLQTRGPGRSVLAVVGLLVALHAAWTAPRLWTPSNADGEEELIRAAAAALPPQGGCLATVRFGDPPPAGDTQRHFPDYLFTPGVEILGLDAFAARQDACLGSAVALLGTRCFMAMRAPELAAEAPADGELAVCRRFRDRYQLEAVQEIALANRTDGTFPMYPSRATLPVGVYRIVGERR